MAKLMLLLLLLPSMAEVVAQTSRTAERVFEVQESPMVGEAYSRASKAMVPFAVPQGELFPPRANTEGPGWADEAMMPVVRGAAIVAPLRTFNLRPDRARLAE